jgi:catechol 2,3-dioxygenase-like lactoylglutathione lyase family enzyme
MEHVIAGLLTDFEQGRMTRRQLIRSLALSAASPAAAAAVQASAQDASRIPAPKNPAPWKTVYLDHISYAVSDYRRSAAFYRDLMGWELKQDEGQRQCTLKIGDIGEIIVRNGRQVGESNGSSTGQTVGARESSEPKPPLTGVINHISWGVQPWDTEKVKSELERRGLNPRPDMVGSSYKSFHVFDPDGWDLQISNQTKENHGT